MHGVGKVKILEGIEIIGNTGTKFIKYVNAFRVNNKYMVYLLLSLNTCSILL